MRHHRRRFRRVIGQRQQAARDVEVAGRQSEGVDDRRIEDRHPIGLLARRIACSGQFREHIIEIMFSGGGVILAAKLRHQFAMLHGAAIIDNGRRRPHRPAIICRPFNRRNRRREQLALMLEIGAGREDQRAEQQRDGTPERVRARQWIR